jgi:hypothetical protein
LYLKFRLKSAQNAAVHSTYKHLKRLNDLCLKTSAIFYFLANPFQFVVLNKFPIPFLQAHEAQIREVLPEQNFKSMVSVLKKFFNFMNLTASVSSRILKVALLGGGLT